MTIATAKSAIRAAFICGVVSAAVTLAAMVYALVQTGFEYAGIRYSIFTLFDVLLIAGLTVGIYFKSRVCATLMFLYFVWNKYVQFTSGAAPFAIAMGLIFLFFYARGAYATFILKALLKNEANHTAEPASPSRGGSS